MLIQQALHGYKDGHQLLAASTNLTRNQESVMLVMSDLSGPAFRDGYESYITGYPVSGDGIYCVAKTWFAPELPRPGCVWTHTLLVRDEELARIPDIRSLRGLFRRPQSETDYGDYEVPISVEPGRGPSARPPLDGAAEIIYSLYSSDQYVVIPAEESAKFEELILTIFSQQWPKLRRGFRFCTGALSIRDTEFDLSVSPPDATHSVGPTGQIVNLRTHLRHPMDEWVRKAIRDLSSPPNEASLRRFLWQFGPDYNDGRGSFRPLAEIYLAMEAVETKNTGDGVLSAIAYFFPQQTHATRLKSELFGKQGLYTARLGGEAEILRMLISHPGADSLSDDMTHVSSRASDLVAASPDVATDIALLALDIRSDNAQRFLEGYVDSAKWPADLLAAMPASLIVMVLDRSPALVTNQSLWRRSDSMELMSRFTSRDVKDAISVEDLVRALIEAEAWGPLRLAMDHYRSNGTRAAFAWIDAQPGEVIDIPQGLFDIAGLGSAVSKSLLESGSLGPRTLAVLTTELDPRSSVVRRTKSSVWLEVAESPLQFARESRAIQSAVFLLNIGLGSREPIGGTLVASAFSTVYQSAKENILSAAAWGQLEPNLEWYSPSWDRCARLIRTAARGFYDRPWPINAFFLTFQTREQLERAISEIDGMWRGHRFLRQLQQGILDRSIRATSDQLRYFASLDI